MTLILRKAILNCINHNNLQISQYRYLSSVHFFLVEQSAKIRKITKSSLPVPAERSRKYISHKCWLGRPFNWPDQTWHRLHTPLTLPDGQMCRSRKFIHYTFMQSKQHVSFSYLFPYDKDYQTSPSTEMSAKISVFPLHFESFS